MQRIKNLFHRSNSTSSEYSSISTGGMGIKSWALWQKILFYSTITIFVILLILFLAIWVVFPLIFMNTISIQRFFMFFNTDHPKNPEYNNPEKYDMDGVVNFYITTQDTDNFTIVSIGAWMILHEDDINSTTINEHTTEDVLRILSETKRPIVLYMHGVACNRILPIATYKVARKHFLVITIDHRGYGDSGPNMDPSELGIVSDTAQIYKWIRSHTKMDIYIWGHSLGTALATHSVRRLREERIVPIGLILESPFSTMREEVPSNSLGKIFSWLPYFTRTILDPLEKNGFLFKTTTNILYVDCPIMIMHALDDNVIPVRLGRKVYDVARTKRNQSQGNVTYHEFPAVGYRHVGITDDPKVPKFIEFIILVVLILVIIFVVLPLIVMCSFTIQSMVIFTHFRLPTKPDFYKKFYFPGFKNRYVPVLDLDRVTEKEIGLWQILPVQLTSQALKNPNFNYDEALLNSNYSVLIYFHGTGESRADSTRKYQLLSYYFHVITFDYRSYADSSKGRLSEQAVENDCKQVYNWVKKRTNSRIYIWGHSLGSALATSTAAAIDKTDPSYAGLILESAFTSLKEELYVHKYGKIFSWLPWFKATVVNPMLENGFIFDTASKIKELTCPIMILHAEDDSVVPCKFGEKLFKLALKRSKSSAVYHQFMAKLEYNHYFIFRDPFLKYYIIFRDFLSSTSLV